MRKVLSRNPDVTMLLIAGYFLLAIVVRILRSPALEVDETQQALFSQYLLLGYGSQPILYTWLQYGLNALMGSSIASLSVLKNVLLFGACVFFWLTARILLRDKALVNIATLGMLTLPPVFIMSQRDLTHTVLAMLAVSLFTFALFRTLKSPSAGGYVLTGLAIGIGALSKYNFVLIPLGAVIAIALEKDLRQRLFDWRMLLTLGAAAALTLPHCLWVVDHMGLATAQTQAEIWEGKEESVFHALDGSFDLLSAFIKGIALTTVIFAVIFFRDIKAILRASDQSTRLVGRIILFSLLFVLLIIWCIDITHIRQKWLSVYLMLWPLYLVLKVQAAGLAGERRMVPMLTVTGVLTLGFLSVLLVRGIVTPYMGRYSLVHIPYDRFAETVRSDTGAEPDYVLAAGGLIGGNLKIQFPDATVLTGNTDIEPLPDSWPQGTVVLMAGVRAEGAPPEETSDKLRRLARLVNLPAPTDIRHVDIPYAGTAVKNRLFSYAVLTVGTN